MSALPTHMRGGEGTHQQMVGEGGGGKEEGRV